MKDNEIKIPPFVQEYIDKLDGEGFADFVKISAQYQKEKEDYPGKFAEQSAHLNEHNRRTGQNRKLDYGDGLSRIDADYQKKAYQTAKQHGYKGPDPFQPADKDFTKQGKKFETMIDQARQRQQDQARQAQQQQENAQRQEKQSVETLKSQPSYQQNKPKVEFDDVDQRRTAFLAQLKHTREQQTGCQHDKEPER
ncbi:hypothetical protein LX99_04416 [Mucilaginibacter oryzae]|uniref:Uncharacterized protein n=1 Tax=Mucilaginibacter oryzae TaxID=468058 RepID=A0A316H0B4_9SPHI|nr:hypothetical protein [Mucilaginibacter oryzae]PWK72557.1 hypothetical protein LX99_04416 [Mucilaginibacter oryzae]